jgi:TolB-like protein
MNRLLLLVALLVAAPNWIVAQEQDATAVPPETPTVYPLAILPFQERGAEVKGFGAKVTDILFAELVVKDDLVLVDREDINKVAEEQELNLSGLVNPAEANKVGRLTGARILVTGSVLQTDKTVYLVAKLIGTETGRVLGASVKGASNDRLDAMVAQLAEQVSKTLSERSSELLPKQVEPKDRLAEAKQKFPRGRRPVVWISVAERHVGQPAIDPAVQTELTLWSKELGFDVLDPEAGTRSQADIVITGEGFSEFAGRVGNLVSVKARIELKAVDRVTDQIVAVDRDVTISVDLTEQIAGKAALQQAAVNLAERMLPKLVVEEKGKKKDRKDP